MNKLAKISDIISHLENLKNEYGDLYAYGQISQYGEYGPLIQDKLKSQIFAYDSPVYGRIVVVSEP